MAPTPARPTDQTGTERSVGRRIADGAVWLILLRLASRALGLISLLIVARLLLPEDYALIALATTIAALLEVAGDFGAELMVIRERNPTRADYDTAYTITLIKGWIDAFILCLLAAPAARWFEDPRLENVIYCCAFSIVIFTARNIGILDFRKYLEINKEFWYLFSSKLIQFFVALILAYIFKSYWALMAGILAHRISLLALSFVLSPYRPRLTLIYWRKYFDFSKWIAINNLLMFGRDRMDTFIVAKLGGPATLGQYQLAHEIANLPTTDLVGPVTRALFPGYSLIANDRKKLGTSFVDSLAALLLVTLPAGLGLGLIGEPLIALIFNENWQDAGQLVTALAVFGVIRAGYSNSGALFLALGRVRLEPVLMAVFIAIAVPLMLIMVPKFGPIGAAYALIVSATINLVLTYGVALKLLELPLTYLISRIWRLVTASLIMTACTVGAISAADGSITQLIAAAISGSTSYALSLWMLWWISGSPDGPERQASNYFANALTGRKSRDNSMREG